MHPHPRPTAVALALVLAVGASACSGSASDAAYTGPPRSGGTLRLALDFDPVCLDPQQSALGQSLNIGRQVVDSLTDQDPRTGRLVPWLATSWTTDAQATRFTFRLREGATFSDGGAVDAAAVKTNLDALHGLGAASSRGAVYLDGYRKTVVEDAHTATVVFAKPNAQFLRATSTTSLGLLSPKTLKRTPQERCRGEIAGSGPFTLDSYRPNSSVSLTRRSGYHWGSTRWKHEGDAYVKRVDYQIVPESTTRSGSLSAGRLDAVTPVAPQDAERFTQGGFRLLTRTDPGVVLSLYVNAERGALRDVRVRRALQKGIDRTAVATAFLGSADAAATGVLASTTPGRRALASDLAYDKAGAERLLSAAGWRKGSDGIRTRNGKRLVVDAIFVRQQSLELVQQQYKEIGVELRLRQLTVNQFPQTLKSKDYDLTLQNASRADPDVLTTVFADQSPVADADLRDRLHAASASADEKARTADFNAVQDDLVRDGYVLPVSETRTSVAYATRVRGLGLDASNRLSLYDTWLA
ncbi:ABC transporter substrate-binding protein [Streptomyces sp. VRA16 Mangrove soil]|uniref:ABC transporter substrate-binding protein n=1 Tax=Streptomyces sp. VRA16 Mangrove soil TaxID=2817434 RepID=UPI001A9F8EA4|nr:ABC transporter substrate-binding protein [Streptomyces sp. VRA16 Mangrove soil]MBO1332649.1 ABC transporter substrate-binding protein [Streptomyces sp. VRA16 Mangrove soil]